LAEKSQNDLSRLNEGVKMPVSQSITARTNQRLSDTYFNCICYIISQHLLELSLEKQKAENDPEILVLLDEDEFGDIGRTINKTLKEKNETLKLFPRTLELYRKNTLEMIHGCRSYFCQLLSNDIFRRLYPNRCALIEQLNKSFGELDIKIHDLADEYKKSKLLEERSRRVYSPIFAGKGLKRTKTLSTETFPQPKRVKEPLEHVAGNDDVEVAPQSLIFCRKFLQPAATSKFPGFLSARRIGANDV
jgi:hypothetical protein